MPSIPDGDSAKSSTVDDATSLDAENQAQPGDQENGSDSSSGQDGKEPVSEENWDPLSVVKKAIGKDSESSEEGTDGDQGNRADKSSKSENDGQRPEDADAPLGDVTEEELKSYKPKTRKRIEGLLDDRSRLTEQVEAIQPLADQMESLQGFMREKNLTTKNVTELLVVGGLAMSDNPDDLRAALKRVDAFKAQIEGQLGETLPDDLRKKVDEGLIDEETAKGVARDRAAARRAEGKAQRAEMSVQTANQTSQQTQEASAKQVVQTTILDWQRQKMSTDPDYPRKAELLQKEIMLRVQAEGGKVLDKNKALKIADEAYAEVTRLVGALSPQGTPPAKRMTQSKAVPGTMASKPNSALEAARAGLAKSKG